MAAPTNINGHGGARAGAGRKPADYVKPPERTSFEDAQARHEAAKAELAEIKLSETLAQFVERDAVHQATDAALASIRSHLHPLPGRLVALAGVSPELATEVGSMVDAALADLHHTMAVQGLTSNS